MTLEELSYWGTPAVPTTLVDNIGHPIGWVESNGTIHMIPPYNTDRGTHEVVWSGSQADPNPHGFTKGRLLPIEGPRYVDSLTVLAYLGRATKEDKEDANNKAKTAKGSK